MGPIKALKTSKRDLHCKIPQRSFTNCISHFSMFTLHNKNIKYCSPAPFFFNIFYYTSQVPFAIVAATCATGIGIAYNTNPIKNVRRNMLDDQTCSTTEKKKKKTYIAPLT